MVTSIKRDNNDIFHKKILGFIFKNQKFLFVFRTVLSLIFFYAIYLGFVEPSKENSFTTALFWGIFWSFFMVTTLPTFGRIFCGICPHGFMGKYITKCGLNKTMPKWLQNRYIGIFTIVVGWWGVYYTFSGVYKTPFATAVIFAVMTIVAFIFYFLYKDMSYCKYICPIGTVTRGFAKLSFTKLGTYSSACSSCKTFDCEKACPYNLKPFTFDKRNNMTDCTLCMECTSACEAVNFKFVKPASGIVDKFKILKEEVWVYLLIFASIPVAMSFAHGLSRSKIADEFIWAKTAKLFDGIFPASFDSVGMFAYFYAILFSVTAAVGGMYIASKILNKPFKDIFYNLGYSYAPLFIFGSLAHTLASFFTRNYEKIVEGFAWAFGFSIDVEPLAKHGDSWIMALNSFRWLAVVLALYILVKRFRLIDASKTKKILAFPFAASLIIFFLSVNAYRGYVMKTYGVKEGGHMMHGDHMAHSKAMFQSVPKEKAIILQKGEHKTHCAVCGMKLPMFYKTNHAATLQNGKVHQYCSIHCLVDESKTKKLTNIKVIDTNSLKFIDALKAYYVVGSDKSATMSKVSKYAFSKKVEAIRFRKKFGGKVVSFKEAFDIAKKDFTRCES